MAFIHNNLMLLTVVVAQVHFIRITRILKRGSK